jgi:DEAD/DEAH box helicase
MFREHEIAEVMTSSAFAADVRFVRESLSKSRIGQREIFAEDAVHRLSYFVEAVLSSASKWENGNSGAICKSAAEIAETLAVHFESELPRARKLRLRAALLYDLASYPAIAQAILAPGDVSDPLYEWFSRLGPFSELNPEAISPRAPETKDVAEIVVASDIATLSDYVQGTTSDGLHLLSDILGDLTKEVSFGLTATELGAFRRVLELRRRNATRSCVEDALFRSLFGIHFPPELWPAQKEAVQGGLLDEQINSWGLASPTGTGKTFLARLLILRTLQRQPATKVLYIVPSRALVYEIAGKLSELFSPLGYEVAAVTPQLVALEGEEASRITEASVLILTPEKADMLLRLGDAVFHELSLVIIDEAHHIESGTRGILLEMYLWRLKSILKGKTRFVFLSAVAPNIADIAGWMDSNSKGVVVKNRPTRMRAGVFRVVDDQAGRRGEIEYTDGNSLTVIRQGVESTDRLQLVQLAHTLGAAGPVLIVVNGKRTSEKLAALMSDWIAKHGQSVPLRDIEASDELL